jgi:hypothetical protein
MREFGCGVICVRYHRPVPDNFRERSAKDERVSELALPIGGDQDRDAPFSKFESASLSSLRYSLIRAVYLAAIAVATLGWLWFLVWMAEQLI